ncbi:MAG: ECF transporter S component [Promethearchaeota archaeon]
MKAILIKGNNETSKGENYKEYLTPRVTLTVSLIGVFSGLICVLTMIISIPIPATEGYINIGDAGVMICGLVFGPLIGGFSGGIGSFLADIFLGYPLYAPGTLIIKGLEGFLVGIIANPKKNYNKTNYKDILAVLAGGSLMTYGYFLYEIYLYGVPAAVYELFLNGIIQFGLGGVIAIVFITTSRKILIDNLPQVFDKIFISKEEYKKKSFKDLNKS